MRCGIPNAYILDITMYKMHVSLCSYCTVRILISKTVTGTYEGGYTYYVFEMCCYRTLDIVLFIYIYIVANYKICVEALKPFKLCSMLRSVSDIFPMLILYS